MKKNNVILTLAALVCCSTLWAQTSGNGISVIFTGSAFEPEGGGRVIVTRLSFLLQGEAS